MLAATTGMGVVLWAALLLLAPVLASADFKGVVALVGVCVVGGTVYAALGTLLGVVRLSELRFVMRRQPGLRSADPDEQP
jgi:putative peptidoglycan lipid II flippase